MARWKVVLHEVTAVTFYVEADDELDAALAAEEEWAEGGGNYDVEGEGLWLEDDPASVTLEATEAVDTTCMLARPEGMPPVEVEDCLYRMLKPTEIQAGMGIRPGFEMWGPARQRVRGLGNAVTPPVAEWICKRMAAIL